MTMLRPAPTPVTRMWWDNIGKQFVADASDLGRSFERVWDDATDVGMTLISRYARMREMVFVVTHTETDNGGDVRYWELHAAPPQRDPGFKVLVFND